MPSFTMFKPPNLTGTLWGVGITVALLAVGLGLVYVGQDATVGLRQLPALVGGGIFLALGVLYGYWTWGRLSLAYGVDRNAVAIRWGGVRQIIPIGSIERLIPASEDDKPQIEGVNWVGHHVGRASIADLGEVLFYSAHRTMSEVLFVQTQNLTYAISVPDQVFFAETVQSHQTREPLFEPRQAVHRSGPSAQSFWNDPQARVLSAVLVGAFIVVLAYVLQIYPGLAQNVTLRFPALGGLLHSEDKSALLDIPRTAAVLGGINLVLAVLLHGWERMVSYVLLFTGIAVQVVLLVAAIVAVA